MEENEVKIIELPPMRVASFLRYSETPETDAITAANNWLKSHNLFKKGTYRQFGFNNPSPAPGSAEYGYEVWILPQGELPEGADVKTTEFPGGLYLTRPCNSVESITEEWQKLITWLDTSEYQRGEHQWLEEIVDPPVEIKDLRFLLYLPISK